MGLATLLPGERRREGRHRRAGQGVFVRDAGELLDALDERGEHGADVGGGREVGLYDVLDVGEEGL